MIALSGWQQREEKGKLVLKRKFKSAPKARAAEQQALLMVDSLPHTPLPSAVRRSTQAPLHVPQVQVRGLAGLLLSTT